MTRICTLSSKVIAGHAGGLSAVGSELAKGGGFPPLNFSHAVSVTFIVVLAVISIFIR
jgi:hypothetical protein